MYHHGFHPADINFWNLGPQDQNERHYSPLGRESLLQLRRGHSSTHPRSCMSLGKDLLGSWYPVIFVRST